MRRAAITTACLLVLIGGALILLVLGTWQQSLSATASLVLLIVGAVVALARARAATLRWFAVLVLAYGAVYGLLLVAAEAPLEGDVGPVPWRDEVIALGGPQFIVGLSWLLAGGAGILVGAARAADRRVRSGRP